MIQVIYLEKKKILSPPWPYIQFIVLRGTMDNKQTER